MVTFFVILGAIVLAMIALQLSYRAEEIKDKIPMSLEQEREADISAPVIAYTFNEDGVVIESSSYGYGSPLRRTNFVSDIPEDY